MRARQGRAVHILIVLITLGLLALGPAGLARSAVTDPSTIRIRLDPVVDGLDSPTFVTSAGDGSGRLYALEKAGRIRVIEADRTLRDEPFLDIRDRVVPDEFEQGLLGLAFHPNYTQNGRFFVDYTRKPDNAVVVSEFVATDGQVDPAAELPILVLPKPAPQHNGGTLTFDAEGMLVISVGDGGNLPLSDDNSQNPMSLLGKILRIDVDSGSPYGIPADNAFADDPSFRPEIHALGFRNPWRFSLDPLDGTYLIGDVGQATWEEIDVMPAAGGLNFGWNRLEGPQCGPTDGACDPAGSTPPVIAYQHEGSSAVIGGYVYRGTQQPLLEGIYVYADLTRGRIFGASAEDLKRGAATPVQMGDLGDVAGLIWSLGEDDDGELYLVVGAGPVLHIVAEPAS